MVPNERTDLRRAFERLKNARFAPAVACSAALAQIRDRYGSDWSKCRVRTGFARGHLLDIVVYLPGGRGEAREEDAAVELVRLLVGEELFERWVGAVSVTPTARGGPLTVLNTDAEQLASLPLASLPDAIEAAVRGLKQGLSARPLGMQAELDDWVLFELSPKSAADYAAQDDLLFSSTRVPESKKSFLRGDAFFSGRFSQSGELFAYLKYEAAEPSFGLRLAERSALEAGLRRALEPERGAVVGLGLGLRYSYIDLALLDPDCMERQLVPAVREAGIGSRAWLLFCDSELEREWIPAHPEASEPFWG